MSERTVYTIGHSNLDAKAFVALLKRNDITAVADVRSSPFSRYHTQFNREHLNVFLKRYGIHYVFLSAELGARSDDPSCYVDGQVQYARLSQTPIFRAGLERVKNGADTHKIALMCAEKDPLECHRTLLVANELAAENVAIKHILSDGTTERHEDAMQRLVREEDVEPLFFNPGQMIGEACRRRESKIAYVLDEARG